MHLLDVDRNMLGGWGIVGGQLPIATGVALALVQQGRRQAVLCELGDGAVNMGAWHESLNLAALWRLPVLFVCENNLYAMGTALARAQSQTDLHVKAASYRLLSETVDGMDVIAVADTARALVEGIRAGAGPAFLECRTYRFRPHSMVDSQLYRDKAEVDAQKAARDPLRLFLAQARETGLLADSEVAEIERAVDAEVDDAIAFAEAGHLEPIEHLLCDVVAGQGGAAP